MLFLFYKQWWAILFFNSNVSVNPLQVFEFRVSAAKGHTFKLYIKRYNSCRIESLFVTERVIVVWNKFPVSIIDFRTLSSFKKVTFDTIALTDLL